MIVNNLKKQLGGKNVLDGISFILANDDRVGLVGINGSGKSTLLKLLAGELDKDFGDIKLNGQTIGYLKQEIPHKFNNLSIIEYIKQDIGIDTLEKRLHELENNLTDDNMEEYGDILNEYLAIDGYSFDSNLKSIIMGLNLDKELDDKIKSLSGGEKIKVLLATLLLRNSDILLLDEPTNNLDIEAIEWLEKTLISSNKEMILVSHDEVFLNNIANKIFELSDGKLVEYNLKYSDYLAQKELEYLQLKDEYERVQEQKDKLKKQVQKAKEWANKGINKKAHNDNDKLANNYAKEKTNTGNISKLTKELENLKMPEFKEKQPIKVLFNFDNSKGNRDIFLENLVCGYDTFKTPELNLLIPFGTKVNIVGGNGTGKTTLIKTILGDIDPIYGNIRIGSDGKIGYISQDTLDNNTDETVYNYLIEDKKDIDNSKIFTLMDKFNFDYDDRNKSYGSLSPGERTRVNLIKLALDNINILILDEVTNHLDKEALDLIYELVDDYKGTIISISHNRKYNEELDADINLDIKTGKELQKKTSKHK
jgi:ATPase subunit of ABC transporter with duplicated ATPase domains